jgi:hypothetical protein
MIDAPTFKKALSSYNGEKIDSVGAYGVFIDKHYAGQIGDTIRIGKQSASDFQIVGRLDGKAWSSLAGGQPAQKMLLGLYGLKKITPQQLCGEGSDVILNGSTGFSCQDFNVEQTNNTDVVFFKDDAFSGKASVALKLDFGIGPVPTNTDVKTIDIKTDPEGAEIYLDSELQ